MFMLLLLLLLLLLLFLVIVQQTDRLVVRLLDVVQRLVAKWTGVLQVQPLGETGTGGGGDEVMK